MKVLILLLTYCEFLIYCLVVKDSSPNIPHIKLTFIPRKIKTPQIIAVSTLQWWPRQDSNLRPFDS